MILELEPIWLVVSGGALAGVFAAAKWASTETAKKGIRAAKRKVYHALGTEVCIGQEALDVVSMLRSDITKILAEVKPNGGSSLKDAVMRLEGAVKAVSAEVRHIRAAAEMASDAAGALLWRAEADGRVMWVSKAIKEQLGFVNDSAYAGWAWQNVVHPDDRERVRERWEQAVEDQCDAQDEYRVVTRDGLVIHAQSYAKPVFVDGGLDGWQGRHSITKIENPLGKDLTEE